MLVDSHCHLDRLDLTAFDHDLARLLAHAHALGVAHCLCIGVTLDSATDVLALAEQHASVSASVGVHPEAAPAAGDPARVSARLRELARHPQVVAIGETGLDYARLPDDPAAAVASQRELFGLQLALARDLELPAIVHTRDAGEDTLELIAASGATGVIHCFTETLDFARAVIELGWTISISGIVTFRNAEALRRVVRELPLERLLVETDSPWLAPVPYRGQQNDPRRVVQVAAAVAELQGISLAALAAATTANFQRIFPRVQLSGSSPSS